MMDKKEEEAKELGDALVFVPLGFAIAAALWFRFDHSEASFVPTLVALGFLLGLIALAFYFAWPLLTTDYSHHAT